MAKIFLDVNIVVDLIERRGVVKPEHLRNHETLISLLSVHILLYVLRESVPTSRLEIILRHFSFIEFTEKISSQALIGPTNDYEDNVQLHSAAEAECDIFLTSDRKLLDMKFFGKTQIISPENLK